MPPASTALAGFSATLPARPTIDGTFGGEHVRDQRAEALAQILVRYSTRVEKGDVCVIQSTTAAEGLVQAVYEEVLRAGGLPVMQLTTTGAQAAFYDLASDEQLDWIPPTASWAAENADVRIAIMGDVNSRELSHADPKKQARAQRARKQLMETSMRRSAAGEHRWALTLFPTHAYASEAGMSLRDYENFYYAACLATDGDPVTAWERQSDQVRRLAEWIQGKEEVRIRADGTDLTLGVGGRRWIPCVGEHNMPDGEFFTGPVENSVAGEVAFSFPASYGGRTVSGVRLRFEDGKVVDASAEQGQEFLQEMLDTDPGARRLGELGIGTNYGISTGTKEILLDEKIGGTVHLAVGMSYPETGGTNSSAVHWDMVCDLREGGSITVDGVELQRDGRFLV
jgi:aminopeptidase